MSIIRSKGTKLQQKIATVYTDVAQIISITLPEMEATAFAANTLDNADAGIPYYPTGDAEGGSVSGELFLDPALAGHQALLELLSTPAPQDWKVVFADTGATEWPFAGAGFKLGGSVALGDGLKASFGIKLNGLPTFP